MNTDKDEDNTSRDIVVTLSYERKVSKRLVMSKLNLCTMLCPVSYTHLTLPTKA